jgi:Condensation domain
MSSETYIFPASFSQQRFWFLDQLTPHSAFYNIDNAIEIHYAINVPLLEQCINRIIERHEALRTVFRSVNGEPAQVILPKLRLRLQTQDLSGLSEFHRRETVVRLATEEASLPFDLSRPPLLRAQLLQLAKEDFLFLLTFHHIVADGWSVGLFFDELAELYAAACEGRDALLPTLSVQYPDYAAWQKQWVEGPTGEKQLAFWTKQLDQLPQFELPVDCIRPLSPSFSGAIEELIMPPELYPALQLLSVREQSTLFMTLFAGFVALLGRWTGHEDIVVGTPVAGRNRSELEPLIGLFLNTVVLRVNIGGAPTFRELLRRVREVALDAFANQEVPFERLVRELRPEREITRNPLYQVSFQLFSGNPAVERPDFGDLASIFNADPVWINKGTSNMDFALDIWETAEGLWGKIEYSTELFAAETIRQIGKQFVQLLRAVILDPDRSIGELAFDIDAGFQQPAPKWSDASVARPQETFLHKLFEDEAARSPDSCALVSGEPFCRLPLCQRNWC